MVIMSIRAEIIWGLVLNERVAEGAGVDEYNGAAVQLNVNITDGCVISLLDRTRVSTNGVDELDPVGGVHMIEMIDAGEPWFKLMIGRDPDEIENHEPDANDAD